MQSEIWLSLDPLQYTILTIEWIRFLDKFDKVCVPDVPVCHGSLYTIHTIIIEQ